MSKKPTEKEKTGNLFNLNERAIEILKKLLFLLAFLLAILGHVYFFSFFIH
jgi:hypothetical protein